jgi:hypothetical protein
MVSQLTSPSPSSKAQSVATTRWCTAWMLHREVSRVFADQQRQLKLYDGVCVHISIYNWPLKLFPCPLGDPIQWLEAHHPILKPLTQP